MSSASSTSAPCNKRSRVEEKKQLQQGPQQRKVLYVVFKIRAWHRENHDIDAVKFYGAFDLFRPSEVRVPLDE